MNWIFGFYSKIKESHQAVIVLSANAHISLRNGYVCNFWEITEGIPIIGCVGFWRLCLSDKWQVTVNSWIEKMA